MNIKINNIERADYWLNQTVNMLNSFNKLKQCSWNEPMLSLEFDAKMVHQINSGV